MNVLLQKVLTNFTEGKMSAELRSAQHDVLYFFWCVICFDAALKL